MIMTPSTQRFLDPHQRARRILAAWNRSNLMELRSVLEESPEAFMERAHGTLAQEQVEMLETVTGTIRTWLQAPSELPEAELQASLSLLHHLSTARPSVHM
jgi:hypothetical protein